MFVQNATFVDSFGTVFDFSENMQERGASDGRLEVVRFGSLP